MRTRLSPSIRWFIRALLLLSAIIAFTRGPSIAAAQTCGQPTPIRLTLGAHEWRRLVYHEAMGKILRFDPAPWEWTGSDWRALTTPLTSDESGNQVDTLAYDSLRHRVVARTQGGTTWEWNGDRLVPMPHGTLIAPERYAMAFDPNLARVVVVGGQTPDWPNPTVVHEQMWSWESTGWAPVNAPPPPPRVDHALGHDPATGRLLLHGGRINSNAPMLGETWAWDGTSWSLANTTGPVDSNIPMFYAADTAMLYYERTDAGPPALYRWAGDAWVHQPVPAIPPRHRSGAAYDAGRNTLVVSGGRPAGSFLQAQTWEFDGADWKLAWDRTDLRRHGHSMAYDAARDRIVAFGGTGHPNQTALFNGEQWTTHNLPGPSPRSWTAMAYDPQRQVVVLHGGTDPANADLHDTWEWNGQSWIQVATAGPTAHAQCMVYDPDTQRCLLVNRLGQLWAWNGAAWTLLATDVPIAANNAYPMLAMDPVRDRLVLVPGSATWTYAVWNRSQWSVWSTFGGVGMAHGGPLVFDDTVNRVVRMGGFDYDLFGGGTKRTNGVFEFDGSAWTYTWGGFPFYGPVARANHPMVWDSLRRRAVFFGGDADQEFDTWAIVRPSFQLPVIVQHPAAATVRFGSPAAFTVQAEQTHPVVYIWRRNGTPLWNTPGYSGIETPTLTIPAAGLHHAGVYDCIVTNACGPTISQAATLNVPCPADLTTHAIPNHLGYATPDGTLNNDDFFYYIAAYARGNLAADFTTTGFPFPGSPQFAVPDGSVTPDDFFAFYYFLTSAC